MYVCPFLSVVGEVFAVCRDDLLVPVEALFAAAGQGAAAVVVLVHIDEAVALVHLAGGGRDQVDAAPGGVAHQVDAVLFHRLFHLGDVLLEVGDAVVVLDAAVGFHLVVGAQAVFDDEEGLGVVVGHPVQGVAQAHRVDLPAPVAGLDIGVAD